MDSTQHNKCSCHKELRNQCDVLENQKAELQDVVGQCEFVCESNVIIGYLSHEYQVQKNHIEKLAKIVTDLRAEQVRLSKVKRSLEDYQKENKILTKVMEYDETNLN